jgi:hypothetical protein
MIVRGALTCIDHNKNVSRPQAKQLYIYSFKFLSQGFFKFTTGLLLSLNFFTVGKNIIWRRQIQRCMQQVPYLSPASAFYQT